MVLTTRRVTAKLGKFLDAVSWAKEVRDYINEKYDKDFTVYSERYGENALGTIFWVASFDSVQAIGEFNGKLLADEGYISKLAAASDLFVSGTTHDSVLDKL